MVAVHCRRLKALAIVVALSGLAAQTCLAQDAKLVAQCTNLSADANAPLPPRPDGGQPPAPAADANPAMSVSCELRLTDAATFQGVKATIKGRGEALDSKYTPFDAKEQTLTVMFLIQVVDPQRRATATQMADAVIKIAEARDGKRRFSAYSIANDLTLLAPATAAKADFDKAVRGLRLQSLPTQLYQTTLEAIEKLAKEPGDRKAIILVGDGNSDDPSYTHEQVVAAAKAANIAIHALGFVEAVTELPRFQVLRRLADETGGFRREIRLAQQSKYNVTPKFASEVLENGGFIKVSLREPPGPATFTLSADLGGGKSESVDHSVKIPEPAQKPVPGQQPRRPADPPAPMSLEERIAAWVKENRFISYAIGVGFALAALGFLLFAFGRKPPPMPATTGTGGVLLTDKNGNPIVYGWLEMLDGDATRHPLRTTNARIGRHRDNDVCLQNDSISRRHALMHFNADTRKFVIRDLGGNNGVVVNKVRKTTHELEDGDLIELGEVRLRFRANMEFLGKKA